MTAKPVRSIDDFRDIIESETFVRLTPDAMQRLIVKISHHMLTPEVIADVTLIAQAGQLLRDEARGRLSQTAAGMVAARRLAQGDEAMTRAAATMVRCAALQRLVAAYMIEASAPWTDEAGTLIAPPTAEEWAGMRKEFFALRDMYAELEKQCDNTELIVTKQTIDCVCDDGVIYDSRDGARDCTLCGGTGKRDIEIARNKPIIDKDRIAQLAETAFRQYVEESGWNPSAVEAYKSGALWGAGYNGES